MRQKKLKYVTLELMEENGVIVRPEKLNITNYHLEIGAGKGDFITSLALDNPNTTFVAIERNINVCYRILEKKNLNQIDNLIIILDDANNLFEYFHFNSAKMIYLNFSDPWPKPRHHKRRLTYKPFLEIYQQLLNKDGIIQFRTDHLAFFNDSLNYFENNFNIYEADFDLEESKYQTEYEKKKRLKGKIYQLKAGQKYD
ncbi:MAG TPA: tRNA (guanosine(46)-N7)-methyltransferase TrmB [Acholeplasmataceae bacterium]|nr:tRNA (guanosine(46)-N7)-methyltransferase TrmB [Acholeplasmataceae bacterium]